MFIYVKKFGNVIFYKSERLAASSPYQIFTEDQGTLPYFENEYDVYEVEDVELFNFNDYKYVYQDGQISYMFPEHEEMDKWIKIRTKRNALLAESDNLSGILWSDFWQQKEESYKNNWTTYRQSLRDITENFNTADEVVWPSLPIPEEDLEPEQPVAEI